MINDSTARFHINITIEHIKQVVAFKYLKETTIAIDEGTGDHNIKTELRRVGEIT